MKDYQIVIKSNSFFSRIPTSEMLFGAFIWGYKQFYNIKDSELREWLQKWASSPNLLVSSAFPVWKNGGDSIFFFPMPTFPELTPGELRSLKENSSKKLEEITGYSKRLEKVKYVTSQLLQEILEGKHNKQDLLKGIICGQWHIVENIFLLNTSQKHSKIKQYAEQTVQKNSIDRLSGSTTPSGETFYEHQIHANGDYYRFCFYLRIPEDEYEKKRWHNVLRYLGDIGIGANRSTGGGKFTIEDIRLVTLPGQENGTYLMTLSRCLTKTGDFDLSKSFYNVVPVRSIIDNDCDRKINDLLKSKVIYLQEGSLLKTISSSIPYYGCSPIVKKLDENIEIYQYGFAYPLFGNIKGCQI